MSFLISGRFTINIFALLNTIASKTELSLSFYAAKLIAEFVGNIKEIWLSPTNSCPKNIKFTFVKTKPGCHKLREGDNITGFISGNHISLDDILSSKIDTIYPIYPVFSCEIEILTIKLYSYNEFLEDKEKHHVRYGCNIIYNEYTKNTDILICGLVINFVTKTNWVTNGARTRAFYALIDDIQDYAFDSYLKMVYKKNAWFAVTTNKYGEKHEITYARTAVIMTPNSKLCAQGLFLSSLQTNRREII